MEVLKTDEVNGGEAGKKGGSLVLTLTTVKTFLLSWKQTFIFEKKTVSK